MSMQSINTAIISDVASHSTVIKAKLAELNYPVIFEGECLEQLLSASWQSEPQLLIAVLRQSNSAVLNKLKTINEQFPLPMVIFTQDDREEAIEEAIAAGVSAYVIDGLAEQRIIPIIKTALARFQQQQLVKQQVAKLKTSLAERKIIDRAKGLVMDQRRCSENEAYTLLRTSAMNNNMRIAALAENLLASASGTNN